MHLYLLANAIGCVYFQCIYTAFLGIICFWEKDGGEEHYGTALRLISS